MKPEHWVIIEQMFKQYGIRNVSMDDISRACGISKKTLYQCFESKEELLDKMIEHWMQRIEHSTCYVVPENSNFNAIDEILAVLKYFSTSFHNINPIFFWELEKYYPKQARKLAEFRENHILKKIRNNLENGLKQNLYREDLNIDIILLIYRQLIRSFPTIIQENELKDKYGLFEILKEIYYYHLNAIVNEEGKKYVMKKLKEINI
ncbi:MAG: TetR/AcrR family transcriptional regulator [Bacteroidales bacterium]|nr:TetR/AcrR family transcriptional regulator [Bacteroidales bacterium]